MTRCINHEISQDGCRKRMRDTSLIKIKLHTPIYGNSGTISISGDVYEVLMKTFQGEINECQLRFQ